MNIEGRITRCTTVTLASSLSQHFEANIPSQTRGSNVGGVEEDYKSMWDVNIEVAEDDGDGAPLGQNVKLYLSYCCLSILAFHQKALDGTDKIV